MERVPNRFSMAYRAIESLSNYDRYRGAYIFGSLARGEAGDNSDIDLRIVSLDDNKCQQINHPFIGGVKLDMSFLSIDQVRKETEDEIEKGERIPMIAEGLIVFDKDGELAKIKEKAINAKPKGYEDSEYNLVQFLIYHADAKAKRYLESDPPSALLSMGININELLKTHYRMNRRWWVSDKRLLRDLRGWDGDLAEKVEEFVLTHYVEEKYLLWSEIIDHILEPLGGRKPIDENNCECSDCQEIVKRLYSI